MNKNITEQNADSKFELNMNLHLIQTTDICFDKCQIYKFSEKDVLDNDEKSCMKKCVLTYFDLMLFNDSNLN
jgi:hypothetical protein